MTVRAWVELPAGSGWADVQLARGRLEDNGYVTETVRGGGRVWVRLSGARLDTAALWVMPP